MSSKITSLIPGTVKSTDYYVGVDTTDTSMAPTGTDKRYAIQQIVDFIVDQIGPLLFQGSWDASLNNPELISGIGQQGQIYIVSIAGTTPLDGNAEWDIGDWVTFNGTIWQKIDNTQIGNVVGPSSSVDNAITRFDSTTGRLIQNSVVTLDDTGIVSGIIIPSLGNTVSANALKTDTVDVVVGTAAAPTVGQVLTAVSDIEAVWNTPFLGPTVSTHRAIPRFDGILGQTLMDSGVTLDDTNNMEGVTIQKVTNTVTASLLATTGADVSVVGAAPPTVNQALVATTATAATWQTIFQGASSSTDNAIARYDGVTGKIIQNSAVTISDTFGIFSGAVIPKTGNTVTASNLATTGSDVIIAGAAVPSTGQVLMAIDSTSANWQTPVSGPASSTDNAVVRWDGTTGRITQNSIITIADTSGLVTVNNATQPYFFGPNASAQYVLVGDQTTSFEKLTYIPADGRIYAFADFIMQYGVSAGDVTNTVENTFSNAASHAVFLAQTASSTGGDPKSVYTTQITSYSEGIDNSDSDTFKICTGTALGSNENIVIHSTGEVRFPRNSYFKAHYSSLVANVTGDGTVYTLIWGAEDWDLNSDYNNSTGVFTAPVTGIYEFIIYITWSGLLSGHTASNIRLQVNGTDVINADQNAGTMRNTGGNDLSLCYVIPLSLTAGDTITATTTVAGSTKVVDIPSDTAPLIANYFSGRLVA